MKQNIEIGESGYNFVCEFDGVFYSGIVKDANLNYGRVREYSLEKLKE